MPQQVQKERTLDQPRAQSELATEVQTRDKKHADLLDESKDWLDEIDEALAGLDQDLAEKYRQKGGQ